MDWEGNKDWIDGEKRRLDVGGNRDCEDGEKCRLIGNKDWKEGEKGRLIGCGWGKKKTGKMERSVD